MGKLSCDAACWKLDGTTWHDFSHAEKIASYLLHYWCDEDIRERDSEYRDMQETELNKLITLLREEDYLKASKVSFLAVT